MVNWQLVVDKLNYWFTSRGWQPEFTLNGDRIQSRDCSVFVITGRGPGKMPPVEALRNWVQSKGIEAGAEWAIAKSIAKYGTKRADLTDDWLDYCIDIVENYVVKQIVEDVEKAVLFY